MNMILSNICQTSNLVHIYVSIAQTVCIFVSMEPSMGLVNAGIYKEIFNACLDLNYSHFSIVKLLSKEMLYCFA